MKTNAVRLLEEMGVRHELRAYDVDPDDLSAETAEIAASDANRIYVSGTLGADPLHIKGAKPLPSSD